MAPARLAACTLALLLGFSSLRTAADSCIWYADDDTIRQVQTSTNEVTRIIPLRHPHRLVMNATDCGVWTLDKHDRRLLRFGAEGALELEIKVRDLDPRLHEVERLQLDPFDGSLWVADDRRLFHVSAAGQLLGRFSAPGEVRRLRVALDQSLWVLGKRELWRFDAQGTLLASYRLGRHLAGDARYFALDSLGGAVWLADEHELAQLTLANPAEPLLRIRLRREITGLALDPLTGNAWVAQKEALLAYSRAGNLIHTVDLESRNLRHTEKLAFDPVSRSLWVGAERSVSRFTDTGQFVTRFAARDGDEALGVPAFKVEPTLTLLRPPENALTNNARPPFVLGYGARCNGEPCGFANDYFGSYSLTALLNSQSVGNSFVFDPKTAEATFTPAVRLPEGTNVFSAQAKDGFGHLSNSISNSFTVDTVAPRFVALSPATGSVFQSPQVTIQGSVDDPKATVVLENAVAFGNAGPNPQGKDFAFPITLRPGVNTIVLTALDPAGNAASAVLQLTLVPVSITIETPASGASIAADNVLVTGTYQGPANTGITVNGVIAATDNNRLYAQVPLRSGSNLLNAVATSPDGATASQGITVTSTGPAPVRLVASSVQGMAPWDVSFGIVSNTVIARIEADYNGDGTVDFASTDPKTALRYTYAAPGTYQARFNVTDSQGNVHILTQAIVVVSVASMDTMLRGTYSAMLARLRAGDIDGALTAFTGRASQKYRAVFNVLKPNLASVVDRLGAIQSGTISAEFAEYSIVRNVSNGQRAFLIYFIRGGDGIWRIDAM